MVHFEVCPSVDFILISMDLIAFEPRPYLFIILVSSILAEIKP